MARKQSNKKRAGKPLRKQQVKPQASPSRQELPVEVREPTKASRRLALLTVLGLVIVLGAAGALLELFVAPLFATPDNDIEIVQQRHAHAPITSELDFLIQMVPHHQEAIDSSRIVAQSSANPEVTNLASTIIDAQRLEIAQMNAWIDAWYSGERYEHSYQPMMPDLERLSGKARDDAYLLGMIAHHEAAVSMAREVQALSPRPEVQALADLIIREQTAEIHAMQELLGYMPVDGAMHAGMH